MNIKKLYEALESDRFDWSYYDLGHAKDEALKILCQPEELIEYFFDAVCEASPDDVQALLKDLSTELTEAHYSDHMSRPVYMRATAGILVRAQQGVGKKIGEIMSAFLDKLIDDNLDSWLASAYEHKCSAEEGMREDYEYERYKEQRMDEVA